MDPSDRYAKSHLKRFFSGLVSASKEETEELFPEGDEEQMAEGDVNPYLLKAAIVKTPAVPVDYSQYTYMVTTDPSISSLGYAVLDVETKRLNCFVPPHVQVVDVNIHNVAALHHAASKTNYPKIEDHPNIFSLEIDTAQVPTCIWYSPSAAELANGSSQLKDYPFNKPRKVPSCSNPDYTQAKTIYLPCMHAHNLNFASCSYASLSEWEDIAVGYKDDERMIAIQRRFTSNRIASYRLVNGTGDQFVEPTDDWEMVRDQFESTSTNQGYAMVRLEDNKKSYFKAVLTTA